MITKIPDKDALEKIAEIVTATEGRYSCRPTKVGGVIGILIEAGYLPDPDEDSDQE